MELETIWKTGKLHIVEIDDVVKTCYSVYLIFEFLKLQ